MKRVLSIVLSIVLVFGMGVNAESDTYKGASGWAIAELTMADADGFITEKISQDFSAGITREEFCEIAVVLYDRLGGPKVTETYNPFTDTTNPTVIKAFNAEIITGMGDNKFEPDLKLTREQLCVMIIRAMKSAGIVFGDDNSYAFQQSYADENEISGWAYSHVMIMNDMKIINGAENKLNPKSTLTREQAVIMLERTFLREFEIEDNVLVAYLGNAADVVIPGNVKAIGEDVFHENNFIQSITIPSSVETIGYASFRNMENLTSISFAEGLLSVGEAAFEQCEQLTNVTLPDTLTTIEFMAFQDCFEFTEIVIPASVELIDEQAFYRCEKLGNVIFEGDVAVIESSAFEECTNVVFVCKEGSNVDSFAKENGITVRYQ